MGKAVSIRVMNALWNITALLAAVFLLSIVLLITFILVEPKVGPKQPLVLSGCFISSTYLPIYKVCFEDSGVYVQSRVDKRRQESVYNQGVWQHGRSVDEGKQEIYVYLLGYKSISLNDRSIHSADAYLIRDYFGDLYLGVTERGGAGKTRVTYSRVMRGFDLSKESHELGKEDYVLCESPQDKNCRNLESHDRNKRLAEDAVL